MAPVIKKKTTEVRGTYLIITLVEEAVWVHLCLFVALVHGGVTTRKGNSSGWLLNTAT